MVNYCCVQGCSRNSKQSSHLYFYSLPKERNRRETWLIAGGRQDLLEKSHLKLAYRFCSRHFAPSNIKNRKLCADAVPTIYLPNCNEDDSDNKPIQHQDIVCNHCQNSIQGFRYKCVSCMDYDLCPKCELLETHDHHYMLRIPRPLKFKIADDLIIKWRTLFKAEHVQPDLTQTADTDSDSSDDEPITKYVKNYDSGVDLTEDVKENIRREISRVLSMKGKPVATSSKKSVDVKKRSTDDTGKTIKKQRLDPEPSSSFTEVPVVEPAAPELVFADVGAEPPGASTGPEPAVELDVKNEVSVITAEDSGFVQPLMHVKLSDDLTELMIEMTHGGQKTIYKYSD